MEWEKIPLHDYVVTALIPFIMYLLYYCFILAIFPVLQSTYQASILLYLQACLPLFFSSWIQQGFTTFTSEASDYFQLLIHWVPWKPLQWLPFQERKMGSVFMYLTALFRWKGNTEKIYTPVRCIIHMCTHDMRKAKWMLSHPLSTQLLHSEAFHRWLRLFSGFNSYWACQTASDLR